MRELNYGEERRGAVPAPARQASPSRPTAALPLTVGMSSEPHGRAPRAGQPGVRGQVGRRVGGPATGTCQRRAPGHHEVGVQAVSSTAGGVQTGQVSQLLTFSGSEQGRQGQAGRPQGRVGEKGYRPKSPGDTRLLLGRLCTRWTEEPAGARQRAPGAFLGRVSHILRTTPQPGRVIHPCLGPPRPSRASPGPHLSSFSWSRSSRAPSSRSSRCLARSSPQSSSARLCPGSGGQAGSEAHSGPQQALSI